MLRDCPYAVAYMDDILVFSKSHKEHKAYIKTLFRKLSEFDLKETVTSVFGEKRLKFLGHELSAEKMKPFQNKLNTINDFPRPQTLQKLREFLGVVNYYHEFQKTQHTVLQPLNDLLKFWMEGRDGPQDGKRILRCFSQNRELYNIKGLTPVGIDVSRTY